MHDAVVGIDGASCTGLQHMLVIGEMPPTMASGLISVGERQRCIIPPTVDADHSYVSVYKISHPCFTHREELPLLYNFFESGKSLNDSNREQHTENLVKSSSLTEEVGHNLDASVFSESRGAPNSHSRDSSPKLLEMDTDASDSARLYKKLRVERSDENKKGHEEAAMDDLSLTMQPPRLLSSNLHPSMTTQFDFPKVVSKHRDCNTPSLSGVFGLGRASQKGLFTDHTAMNSLRESTAAPLLTIPPADEGSRTGLKGSSVGSLLNRAMAGPVLSLGQSKSSSRGAGSESTYLASQETTPITRQLTIFYGGQAHVFEDVSLDKAEAIMALAGSTGRSWSTVYSPQPKASLPISITEGSLSTYDRDRVKAGSKPSSATYADNNSGFSNEVRNVLSSLLHKHGRTGDTRAQEQSSQFAKWATDMQIVADHVGMKAEGTTQVSIRATNSDKEPFA
ncbi:hypothetical protein GOP47_0016341 [Adiantum capillus-veneris]|uniref:Tify domain-containing protein n=1 Tax=Adiantum capillus-veneris TaxID=13818 RepID=A0A9D4UIJ7_ADICA|nr:hypothetical protein GOP47_0016341 [Adiantum capillus-veneris]